MIERKTKSVVIGASAVIGSSGVSGYFHGVSIFSNGAATGTLSIYDGINATTGTLKWVMQCTATAGVGNSVSGLNIHCPNGIYALITTVGYCSIEYSGC
jgi:hypothetical protein